MLANILNQMISQVVFFALSSSWWDLSDVCFLFMCMHNRFVFQLSKCFSLYSLAATADAAPATEFTNLITANERRFSHSKTLLSQSLMTVYWASFLHRLCFEIKSSDCNYPIHVSFNPRDLENIFWNTYEKIFVSFWVFFFIFLVPLNRIKHRWSPSSQRVMH